MGKNCQLEKNKDFFQGKQLLNIKLLQVLFVLIFILSSNFVGAKTLFVDINHPAASNQNTGTEKKPLKSIQSGVDRAVSGDTILVKPGVYRESILISGTPLKPITLKSFVKHKAIISGSDVIKEWKQKGDGIWSYQLDESLTIYTARIKETCGRRLPRFQIYVDKEPLEWRDYLENLVPGTWFLDRKTRIIYACFPIEKNMDNSIIEIALRGAPLMFKDGRKKDKMPRNYIINGFHITHIADMSPLGKFPLIGGANISFINNLVDWASNCGTVLQYLYNSRFLNNTVKWCGGSGASLRMFSNCIVKNNNLLYNNWRLTSINWAGSGMKIVRGIDNKIENNNFAFNYGAGFWSDISCNRNLIAGNLVHDNFARGIFTEVDWNQTIKNNIVFNSRRVFSGECAGIVVGESSDCKIFNNVIFDCDGDGLRLRHIFPRKTKTHAPRTLFQRGYVRGAYQKQKYKQYMAECNKYCISRKFYSSLRNNFFHNISFNNSRSQYTEPPRYPPSKKFSNSCKNLSDNNIFWSPSTKNLITYGSGRSKQSYGSLQNWQKASKRDKNSLYLNPVQSNVKLPVWAQPLMKNVKQYLNKQSLTNINKAITFLVDSPNAAVLLSRAAKANRLTKVRIHKKNIYAVKMRIGNKNILALWHAQIKGLDYVSFKTTNSMVEIETPWLNKRTIKAVDGIIDVPVTFRPIYILNVPDKLSETSRINLALKSNKSQNATVTLSLNNNSSTQAQFIGNLILPAMWKTNIQKIKEFIPPNANKKITIPIQFTGQDIPSGQCLIQVRGKLNQHPVIAVTKNRIDFGNSRKLFFLGAKGMSAKKFHEPNWRRIARRKLLLTKISSRSLIGRGDKSQWQNSKDLSACIWGTWTKGELYFAIQVKDDKIIENPDRLFNGDSFELFIDARSEEMQFDKNYTNGCFQLIISPKNNLLNPYSLSRFKTVTKLDKDGYRIMIKIPIKRNTTLTELNVNQIIRLAFQVNDCDEGGKGKKKTITFIQGGNSKNHSNTLGWIPMKLVK